MNILKLSKSCTCIFKLPLVKNLRLSNSKLLIILAGNIHHSIELICIILFLMTISWSFESKPPKVPCSVTWRYSYT